MAPVLIYFLTIVYVLLVTTEVILPLALLEISVEDKIQRGHP